MKIPVTLLVAAAGLLLLSSCASNADLEQRMYNREQRVENCTPSYPGRCAVTEWRC